MINHDDTAGASHLHRRDIDGLRALSILAVVLFHCKVSFVGGGFVGVDVFFVISGYVIASLLSRQLHRNQFSLKIFYERRFNRIFPPLILVQAFILAMAFLVTSPAEAVSIGKYSIAATLSFSNVLFDLHHGYFDAATERSPLLMTWSLAVEEQFYLVFPLLLLLLAKLPRRTILAVLGVLCSLSFALAVLLEFRGHTSFNFYMLFPRAWELGVGAWLGVYERGKLGLERKATQWSKASKVVGLMLVVGTCVMYSSTTRFPGYEAVPPVLGAALILWGKSGPIQKLLEWEPLCFVGRISYSLYLWHWPMLSLGRIVGTGVLSATTTSLLMFVALLLSVFSYFYVEVPARSKGLFVTRRTFAVCACVVLCFITVESVFAWRGMPQRQRRLSAIEEDAKLSRDRNCLTAGEFASLPASCTLTRDTTSTKYALLGDSHAEAFSGVLNRDLHARGIELIEIFHARCSPTLRYTRWITDETFASCRDFNQDALRFVTSRPDIQKVILMSGWVNGRLFAPDGDARPGRDERENMSYVQAGIREEIGALQAAHKKVLFMEDFPEYSFDPVASTYYREILARRFFNRLILAPDPLHWRDNSVPDSEVHAAKLQQEMEGIQKVVGEFPDTLYIPTWRGLCHGDRCAYRSNHELYYFDSDHISDAGARLILSGAFPKTY